MTQFAQVLPVGSQVVVDEDRVVLPVRQELGGDLAGMAHSIRHTQAIGCQVAKPAPVVAAAGGNQTGGGEKAAAWENRSPWRWVLAIVALIVRRVFRPQAARFHIGQNARPELHAIADGQRVRMRRALFWTREDVQSAQHDFASAAALPSRASAQRAAARPAGSRPNPGPASVGVSSPRNWSKRVTA